MTTATSKMIEKRQQRINAMQERNRKDLARETVKGQLDVARAFLREKNDSKAIEAIAQAAEYAKDLAS